jgi:uncharacterized SAM-binding protein YcdF (DUF218 family)
VRRIWQRRRQRGRLPRLVVGTALVAVLAWAAGFVWFTGSLPRAVDKPLAVTDAIAVLTGGSRRLAAGLELLARGRAAKLFVSGVYRGVEVDEILRVFRQAPEELECCVALGHSATDTRSNAHETARWMVLEGFSSLRLVTASYHMPRSLVEFRRVMPDVQLIAHPVFPAHVRLDAWWRWPGTASLLASEYTKYLVATVTPAWLASAMVPDQEATAP